MQKKFFITTPIYYVNDEPHIGHAYCSVIADILARYHRLFGYDVFFLTGTDEHGQKVAEAAVKAGRSPQEQCDLMVQRFQAVWKKMNLSHDDFIRTTEERHTTRVQEVLQKLWDAGEIYADAYEGWYCVPEERFWTEKDLVDNNCPSCGREVQRLTEKNYFFRMGKYQQWLIDYIKDHPRFILPRTRRNEILGFLQQPLGDLCISRPRERLAWGIPLPFDDDFVTYVWFDALYNYVTAPHSLGKQIWPASLHLIGKDILTTHCVYWPTMLKASGHDLPETIFGHGWWLFQEAKMSKSLGNVVKPLDLVDKYGVDAFRYFLAREMSLGQDASFSEEALVGRYNSELANDLGNLYSRLLKLNHTYCEGKYLGQSASDATEGVSDQEIDKLIHKVKNSIEKLKLNTAIDELMTFVRGINKAIEVLAPWKTGKTEPEKTREFLAQALKAVANVAGLLMPVMPEKMGSLLTEMGIPQPVYLTMTEKLTLPEGRDLPKKAALFPRVKYEAPKPLPEPVEEEMISFDEFKRMQLKIARVLSAAPAPDSEKLLILQVDLGDEKRQLVAGIAQQYQPQDLIGKLVVVVANLKPAKIRGIESRGMLLAAEHEGKLVILSPDGDIAPGAEVM
jgi:methionyl-tRNA synthetase